MEGEPSAVNAERTALKEWAVLADAMAAGEIVAMIRKGGIREQRAGFSVRHPRFVIYPTYFHEKVDEVAPRFRESLGSAHARQPEAGVVRIELVADVLAVWRVTDLGLLRDIGHEHGLAWGAVESRFRYRDKPWLHVVAARVSRLPAPVLIPEARRYQGCVSWVSLDAPVALAGAVPVLPDDELTRRVRALRDALGAPDET